MIQASNISFGETHHIWSKKIAKYQDREVYML